MSPTLRSEACKKALNGDLGPGTKGSLGEGGFRFTAFSQLKMFPAKREMLFVGLIPACGLDSCGFWLGRGPRAAELGPEEVEVKGCPLRPSLPQMPRPPMALEQGIWNVVKFFVFPLKIFFFALFSSCIYKNVVFPLVSKSSLQMSDWEISVCMVSGFLLQGSVALVGFHCDFGW